MGKKSNKSKKIAGLIDTVASVLERWSLAVSVLMGGAMVVIVIAGVIARYAMQNPLAWTEEASRFLMIWMVLIGMSVVARNRENLSVLFLVTKFPIFLQRIVKFLTELLVMIFLYILVVEGMEMALKAKVQIVPSIGITMFYPLFCIPVGGLLTMIQLGLQMLLDMLRWGSEISPYDMTVE
ncbi:TRAP transporter small permease [Desulfococcaceae bacterium HSG9]|nr:TRAP transporter small permease [Desulfococcaceae bacterium HSG9]